LIDTAGLNHSPAPLEKLGIEKTRERLAEADLVLVVLDASAPVVAVPDELAAAAGSDKILIALNKSDLRTSNSGSFSSAVTVNVSAKTGAGIEELTAAMIQRADSFQKEVGGDLVAINARHARALEEARRCLSDAQQKLITGDAIELMASDLHSVLAAYGEITGKVDNERMLDQLFATFCIGK